MQKYTDTNRAIHNYSLFGRRWAKINKDFEEFTSHLNNLQPSGITGITVAHVPDKQRVDVSAYGREFSAQLYAVVDAEYIYGLVKFYERTNTDQTREVTRFIVDGGMIQDVDRTNYIPSYDSSSIQLRYWINLIDAALSITP